MYNELLEKGGAYIKAQLKKDKSNRYSLSTEWILPVINFTELPQGEYHGKIINILSDGKGKVLIWLNPYTSTKTKGKCDGASCVPDVLFNIDFRPGAIAHDPWYEEMDDIAKHFAVPRKVIRKLGDRMFASINLAENKGKAFSRTICTLYYWGVRIFGGIYNKFNIIIAMSLILCGGCNGCVSSSFDNDDEDYRSPIYEHVVVFNEEVGLWPCKNLS